MSTEPTITRVKNIIAEYLGVETETISETSRFHDDLGCDSLDVVEIVMNVEEEFSIEITDEEAGAVETVADAVKLVDGKVAA